MEKIGVNFFPPNESKRARSLTLPDLRRISSSGRKIIRRFRKSVMTGRTCFRALLLDAFLIGKISSSLLSPSRIHSKLLPSFSLPCSLHNFYTYPPTIHCRTFICPALASRSCPTTRRFAPHLLSSVNLETIELWTYLLLFDFLDLLFCVSKHVSFARNPKEYFLRNALLYKEKIFGTNNNCVLYRILKPFSGDVSAAIYSIWECHHSVREALR